MRLDYARKAILAFCVLGLLASVAAVSSSQARADDFGITDPGSTTGSDGTKPQATPQISSADRQYIYQALDKSPELSVTLSLFTGFGAGNFYAGDSDTAYISATAQAAALFLALIGGHSVVNPMIAVSVILRGVDAMIAYNNVSAYNDDVQQHFQSLENPAAPVSENTLQPPPQFQLTAFQISF